MVVEITILGMNKKRRVKNYMEKTILGVLIEKLIEEDVL